MDRIIVYPGAVPLDTDVLTVNRNTMVALGYLAQATLGTSVVADGLACLPTVPASMTVNVGAGSITQLSVVDTTAYGSLGVDTTDPVVKVGVNTAATAFTLTAPGVSGQSINYLIEATMTEADSSPMVLSYYNAQIPQQPYSGPNNNGLAQNTIRTQRVGLQLKAGAPAATGAQLTPAVDSGWTGLYIITVNYGQTTVTSGSIAAYPNNPILSAKLPALAGALTNIAQLQSILAGSGTSIIQGAATGTLTAPSWAGRLYVQAWGAGANGGAGASGVGGGGGGGGAYVEGTFTISPGAAFPYSVGAANSAAPTEITDSFGNPLFIANAGSAGTAAAGPSVGVGGAGGTFSIPTTYPSNCVGANGQGGQNGIETSSAPGYVAYLGGTGGAPGFGGYPTANEVVGGQANTSIGGGGSGGGTGAGGGAGIGLLKVKWLPATTL